MAVNLLLTELVLSSKENPDAWGSSKYQVQTKRKKYLRISNTKIHGFVYTTTHCSLKAYCAILAIRSNFRHQASPRVSPRESTQRRKVELWDVKCPRILPKMPTSTLYLGIFYMPYSYDMGLTALLLLKKEGVLRIFPPLKIRRLQTGVNQRTWVPKASTLPLDHRNRLKIHGLLKLLYVLLII